MIDIEIGQVIALKIRFNNSGEIARSRHPYLIIDVNKKLNVIEIAQIDSLEGKEYKAAMKSNKTIFADNPAESVIDKDSYVQLDNTIKIELFEGLIAFRRQKDKLSEEKLQKVMSSYKEYHESNVIDENKQVYMTEEEIRTLNS